MEKPNKEANPDRSGDGILFTVEEIDTLRVLLGYVLAYDAVRPPYPAEVASILAKVGLGDEGAQEAVTAEAVRAPVRMQ